MKKIVYILGLFIWLGACGSSAEDDFTASVSETEVTTDIIPASDIVPTSSIDIESIREVDRTVVITPEYIYTAFATGYPVYRFTVKKYGIKRGYASFIHKENHDKPTSWWELEFKNTEIMASLYHNSQAHFVGRNAEGQILWKYVERINIVPDMRRVKSAGLEQSYSLNQIPSRIDDIVAAPDGGFFIIWRPGWPGSGYESRAGSSYYVKHGYVGKVSDVYTNYATQAVVPDTVIHKLIVYNDRLIAFGKKDNRLVFTRFYYDRYGNWLVEGSSLYPYTPPTVSYSYDYDIKINHVLVDENYFYVAGFNGSNVFIVIRITNPY